MRAGDADLGELQRRLESLEREYDLFLAGARRAEPDRERRELDRAIRKVVGSPLLSTAERFRATTLAHRFRALESRIRVLLERREGRGRPAGADRNGVGQLVVDRALLGDAAAFDRYVGRLHGELERAAPGGPVLSREALRDRIRAAAQKHLGRGEVRGVRFRLEMDGGRPKIRGDLLLDRGGGEPEAKG